MIGNLLSMRFIGKESWGASLVFWAVVLVAGLIIGGIMATIGVPMLAAILGIAVAILIAMKFFSKTFMEGLIIVAIAYVIDIILWSLLAGTIIAAWFGGFIATGV